MDSGFEAEMRRFENEISAPEGRSLQPPPMLIPSEGKNPQDFDQQRPPSSFIPPVHVNNTSGTNTPPPPPPSHLGLPPPDMKFPPGMNLPPFMPMGHPMPPPPMGPMGMMGGMGPMRPMFDGPPLPMPPFMPPPPGMQGFGKPVERKAVYSSAPVLKKKRKSESSKKSGDGKGEEAATKKPKVEAKPLAVAQDNLKTATPPPPQVNVIKPQMVPRSLQPVHQHAAASSSSAPQQSVNGKPIKKKKMIRTAAGQKWEDPTLNEWDATDYRIFCGDLGNEVTDDTLTRVFTKYSSFQKARVVRDKNTNKSRGYGFVSMKEPNDFIRAIREMNGKYVGNRPIKLRKSNWKERNIDVQKKKTKERKRLGYKI